PAPGTKCSAIGPPTSLAPEMTALPQELFGAGPGAAIWLTDLASVNASPAVDIALCAGLGGMPMAPACTLALPFASNASSAVCPILPNRLPKAPSSSEYGNRKLDPPRFVAGRLESGPDLPHRAWPLGSEVRSRTYEDGADFVHHRVEGVRLAVELRHR